MCRRKRETLVNTGKREERSFSLARGRTFWGVPTYRRVNLRPKLQHKHLILPSSLPLKRNLILVLPKSCRFSLELVQWSLKRLRHSQTGFKPALRNSVLVPCQQLCTRCIAQFPYGFSSLLLRSWVRLVSVISPRRIAGRRLAKNLLRSFSAQLDRHVSLDDNNCSRI